MTTRVMIVNFGPGVIEVEQGGTKQKVYPGTGGGYCYVWPDAPITVTEVKHEMPIAEVKQ